MRFNQCSEWFRKLDCPNIDIGKVGIAACNDLPVVRQKRPESYLKLYRNDACYRCYTRPPSIEILYINTLLIRDSPIRIRRKLTEYKRRSVKVTGLNTLANIIPIGRWYPRYTLGRSSKTVANRPSDCV